MSTAIVRICGIVLIIASLAKAREVCIGCPTYCVFGSCLLTVLVSIVEGSLGVVLSTAKTSRVLSLSIWTYLVLYSVAVVEALLGEEVCSCFGRVKSSPLFMVVFDAAVVLILLWTPRPTIESDNKWLGRRTLPTAVFFLVVWCGLVTIVQIDVSRTDGFVVRGDRVHILPRNLLGKSAKHVLEQLGLRSIVMDRRDEWRLVLVRGNCRDCVHIISEVESRTDSDSAVVYVLVPPYGHLNEMIPQRFARGMLAAERAWIVETPLVFTIVDSRVAQISRSLGELGL
jgi:hypothetical protein